MFDNQKGEIGYHEVAKELIKRNYTVSKPEVDTGTDIVICKNGKCKQGQIKTIVCDSSKNTTTLSGNNKKTFREKHKNMILIVCLLSSNYKTLGELIFTPSEIPDVQSMAVSGKSISEDNKYYSFLDNYDSLEKVF